MLVVYAAGRRVLRVWDLWFEGSLCRSHLQIGSCHSHRYQVFSETLPRLGFRVRASYSESSTLICTLDRSQPEVQTHSLNLKAQWGL